MKDGRRKKGPRVPRRDRSARRRTCPCPSALPLVEPHFPDAAPNLLGVPATVHAGIINPVPRMEDQGAVVIILITVIPHPITFVITQCTAANPYIHYMI